MLQFENAREDQRIDRRLALGEHGPAGAERCLPVAGLVQGEGLVEQGIVVAGSGQGEPPAGTALDAAWPRGS